ncbi:hypothetical protein CPU12_10790 [Malaciobacter molluscorum LMG 25693]|uniref:RND family efflux system, outer membrane channel protein, TolC family n=1 Tax=Malaciobacter molluscorum LMG 25693 TaxID=870501 RepID=A0A2G1DFZ4_9BACT|nr:TolC family protein [Malaciobacter molluscorum]AXX91709.1 RND family efflux system, outer membrane channel protein, TolC family [Malaciobacter molluscorum LMG 25693]PHO17403.1 hypothetical protein CPU12_10790 [Malaciobacter molluscorum LMG 25693]RXJ92830.1 hypothetical protein CRV00_12475 [Malaciobacter molluscorum]
MKKSLLLLSILFLIDLNALDIKSAIDIALKNNNQIKQKTYEFDESRENITLNKSGFKPKFDLSYGYSDMSKVLSGKKRNSTATAAFSYNLFNGFSDFNLVKSAKYNSQSSKLLLYAFKEDIVYSTKVAYINYLNAMKNKKSYEVEYTLFKKQYEDSKNRFEQGLIAKNDILDVHVKMLRAKQSLTRASSDLKIAKFELSNILGGINLDNVEIDELNEKNISLKKYDKKFLDNRSEIKALKKTIQSLKSKLDSTKGTFLPSIDTSLSYNKFGDDINPHNQELDNQKVAQITLKWNLYNGGTNHSQMKIEKLKIRQIKEQLQKTKLDIKLQYQEAKSNFEVANLNLDSAKLALTQAKENYKIVSDKFDEGIVKSTDLTDANYLLTSAKQLYFQAYYDKFLAIAKLDRIFEKGMN